DLAGNRTAVWENDALVANLRYNDANQVIGWSYDAAGNLLSDGATTRSYDALNRLVAHDSTSYPSNGDGVLVSDGTTTYAQDLAAPLSQVLSDGTANYVYGHARLRALGGPWYIGDALGSVRQTLDDAGGVLGSMQYDPWGVPTAGTPQPFGFTGELHNGGQVYLRARWYAPGQGRFVSEDPFAGFAEMPYSLHAYQYAYSAPTVYTDPSGECVGWIWGDPTCQFIGWERVQRGDLEWEEGRPWGGAAVDVTPGVGDVKGLIEVFTGCDSATGEDLGWWRWAGVLGASELRHLRHLKALPPPRVRGRVNPIAPQGPLYSNGKGQTYSQAQFDAVMARRAVVMSVVDETVAPFLPEIRAIAGENARIGYRGSLASGVVGNAGKETYGMPIDLDHFDIDFLIVDDDFAATFTKRKGARWGNDNPALRRVLRRMHTALRAQSELSGLKPEPLTVRVWTHADADRKLPPGTVVYFP
ncbi:MAG: RHS repeat domain-containing protein, partial [Chloroflexaceae bacterium]